MQVSINFTLNMTPAQVTAFREEYGLDNTAASVRNQVAACAHTVLSEEFERIGADEKPFGTLIPKGKKA